MTGQLAETGLNLTLIPLSVGIMLGVFSDPPPLVVNLIRCAVTTGAMMLAAAAVLATAGGITRWILGGR